VEFILGPKFHSKLKLLF